MKIIPILNGMLVLTSGIGFSIQQVRAQQKPHIILIMADQHRGDALGCMGNHLFFDILKELKICQGSYNKQPLINQYLINY